MREGDDAKLGSLSSVPDEADFGMTIVRGLYTQGV
jgi:hypothetical protein